MADTKKKKTTSKKKTIEKKVEEKKVDKPKIKMIKVNITKPIGFKGKQLIGVNSVPENFANWLIATKRGNKV